MLINALTHEVDDSSLQNWYKDNEGCLENSSQIKDNKIILAPFLGKMTLNESFPLDNFKNINNFL